MQSLIGECWTVLITLEYFVVPDLCVTAFTDTGLKEKGMTYNGGTLKTNIIVWVHSEFYGATPLPRHIPDQVSWSMVEIQVGFLASANFPPFLAELPVFRRPDLTASKSKRAETVWALQSSSEIFAVSFMHVAGWVNLIAVHVSCCPYEPKSLPFQILTPSFHADLGHYCA